MSGIAAFAQNAYPLRFTPRISSQLSALASTTVWYIRIPALLTRTSSRPKRSAACWTKAAASASRSMCASTKSAVAPSSAATRLPRSTSRSANATLAPSATNRRTVASPMPDAPPVTAAIFPLSRAMPWSASVEQRQFDGVAHRAIAQVARVKVVAAIVDRQHPGRMIAIAQGLVEIGDRVERVALAQPLVDLLADRLALGVPGAGQERLVLEWRQRGADDRDPARLAAHGELLEPGDHLRGSDFFLGLAPTVPQIVGPQHDDGVGDAGLGQHVAVDAAQAAVAPDIVQDAVAAEPLVHHRHRSPARPRDQPARELRGPAVMAVVGRDIGVGQRIAERDDRACLVRRDDVDAAEEVPVVGEAADRHELFGGEVSRRRDVIGLPRIAPGDPEARRHVTRQVHADGKVRQWRERQLDWIADDERAGGDRRAGVAAEGEPSVGARRRRRTGAAQANAGRRDHQGASPIGVRDTYAQPAATDTDPRDHSQRMVAEGGAFGRRRRRRPGADPVRVVSHDKAFSVGCMEPPGRWTVARLYPLTMTLTRPGRSLPRVTGCDYVPWLHVAAGRASSRWTT